MKKLFLLLIFFGINNLAVQAEDTEKPTGEAPAAAAVEASPVIDETVKVNKDALEGHESKPAEKAPGTDDEALDADAEDLEDPELEDSDEEDIDEEDIDEEDVDEEDSDEEGFYEEESQDDYEDDFVDAGEEI